MKKRPAASTNPLPPPAPIEHPFRSIRSCSKCIGKKSKCRPALPYCEPCWSSGRTEECDIEEHIVLPYSAAKAREVGDDERRRRVEWLEGELRTRTGSDVAGTPTGTRLTEPIRELGRVPVDPLSLELGLLALDSAGAPSRPPLYVGTASGLTITRLLSAVLQQSLAGGPADESDLEGPTARIGYKTACAGVPPHEVARSHLKTYLERIHRSLPFLSLDTLCQTFDAFYRVRTDPTAPIRHYDRFLFFAILAIGSAEARSTSINTPADPFVPQEYFASTAPFLERISAKTDLELLSAVLLTIVYGISDSSGPSIDLWLYSGHAMRLAIELGLTRPVSAWELSPQEQELRRRIWWCTYSLERNVAVRLGRVLSIRNEGIDAEWPLELDEITPVCDTLVQPVALNYRAGLHLVRLSRIYGDILESVYIARPVHRPSMTIEETLKRVWAIQNTLVEWANSIPTIAAAQSTDFNHLTLAFHRACLLLHRPSPSFPNQPENVHSVCLRSARAAINLTKTMLDSRTLSRTWRNFHDSFLDGLVLMFSSWASPTSTSAITSLHQARDQDLDKCSTILLELSTCLPPNSTRYVRTFDKVVMAFDSLLGIGASARSLAGMDDFLFDWSIFDQVDGFELEQGAVEMIRMLTSGVQADPQ